MNFARWRHVDDDTAARFIEALDAMDGATEPMESDSDMNVKSLDSYKDVTSGLHALSKRSERSVSDIDAFRATRNTVEQRNVTKLDVGASFVTITPDTLGQRDVTQSHFVPTFVTITISREDAEELYGQLIDSPNEGWYSRVFNTVHDALEEER